MARPVILLAFADDDDAHLPLLEEESSMINYTLSPLHDRQILEVFREESTQIEELISSFQRFDGRLAIFHYGGHASGKGFRLEDGEAGAKGLAQLLGMQHNLKLVFLNGCSTLPQVDYLMELGVKAVIATEVSIQDGMAKDFSIWFFQAMVAKKRLEDAFNYAVAALNTKYPDGKAPGIIEYRSFNIGKRAEKKSLPWGLYINESAKDILDWRFPGAPIQSFLSNPLPNYKPNDYLPKILGAMARYDGSLKQTIEKVKAGKMDKREVLPMIIQNLPWTVGAQLQKLISRSESMRMPGIDRLQQTINTYVISSQCLLYILASQAWEEGRKNEKDLQLKILEDLLTLDESQLIHFDYLATFHQLGKYFQGRGWKPFVTEFEQLFESWDKQDYFYKSYLLLESIRDQLDGNKVDTAAIPNLCEEAENSLSIFIGSISFLIKYKMVAIRDISVTSTRYQEVAFHHKMGSLNASDSTYLNLESVSRPFSNYVESGSVLLVDNLENAQIDRYLSLSPFFIDNNAFLDKDLEALDIYLFSHVASGEYVYKNVNNHFQKMEQHQTYTLHTGYEERKEVKDEVDIGWEFNESTHKVVKPYEVLRNQFEHMKTELIGA